MVIYFPGKTKGVNPKCPTTKHHVCEKLILNQRCSQKYNNNENIHVDNNEIKLYQKTEKNEDYYKYFYVFLSTSILVHDPSSSGSSSLHIVGLAIENGFLL